MHFEGSQGVLVVGGGEDDDWQVGLRDAAQDFKSIHLRHLDIKEEEVGFGGLDLVNGFKAVRAFGEDLEVLFFSQEEANALPG